MAQQVTCSDTECRFYEAGKCIADLVDHTSDRFCTSGRRKPRDETPELMQTFKAGCRATHSGYKSNHGRIVK
ncbi:hypothetical protein SPSIL_054490 [Sporomusa silvacetica DSM 10669]|uniref:DUF1540 domain-containing protein n=1 Tax=Sporomusa silvacetica DSM 10669 TaxID=1123289 RepID=A0ABZ3IUP4_9FIRM|nr:hypothetical protein SPSIL_11310 [Sporomusa silvacetica DSM 10669]